tara:strand:- start:611 stop:1012 length:402 start_codon:yes stop_codon:yes gene_type:complete
MKKDRFTDVVVGILVNINNEILFCCRPKGKSYEGYWEFPGGKVKNGESFFCALKRELYEEIGITVTSAKEWCGLKFCYPHGKVRLHFYVCERWKGEPFGQESQVISWQKKILVNPILPATIPLLPWLDELRNQ